MRVARAVYLVSSVLFTRLVTGNHRGIVILQVCIAVMFSVTFPYSLDSFVSLQSPEPSLKAQEIQVNYDRKS